MSVDGRALSAVCVGTVLVWSGIKGWSVLSTIGDVISGTKPSQQIANPVTVGSDKGTTGFGSAPSGIAAIAVQYVGHAYHFGGAPGPDGSSPWDCSSFVNWIVSVKAGRAIPGNAPGKYTGSTHGPPTGVWAAWSGLQDVKRADVQSGDILIWLGHMGIAVSNKTFVSALNPNDKTRITDIDAGVGHGPLIRIGRLK